ncbi:MAG: hypothetical protein [Siphoviridae sp. ctvD11]|nr:MAG: hypothetical protein [Siphoviridae sp. ctvD11]
MDLALPVSKQTVVIKDSLTYKEFRSIEHFYNAHATFTGGGPQFDGNVLTKQSEHLLLTMIASIGGKPTTLEAIDALDSTDGQLLEEKCQAQFDAIKKKRT